MFVINHALFWKIIQSAQINNLSAKTSDALARAWSAMEKTIVEMATKQMKSIVVSLHHVLQLL